MMIQMVLFYVHEMEIFKCKKRTFGDTENNFTNFTKRKVGEILGATCEASVETIKETETMT